MHEYVFFNEEIFRAEDTAVCAASSAALYGKGIFTTIAIYDSKPFLWEKHWRRLQNNAEKSGINLSAFSEEIILRSLVEIIGINKAANARARLTFFDEAPNDIWSFRGAQKTSLLIMTADLREIPGNFRLTVSPFRINSASPLASVKSCNYLEKVLALEEAKKRGDEAAQINERGEIVSACMANIFWTNGEKLFTPPLETGCLAGTTREFLMEKYECAEIKTGLEDLRKADAIFLTSAGIGVVRVGEFETIDLERKSNDFARMIENTIRENTRSATKID